MNIKKIFKRKKFLLLITINFLSVLGIIIAKGIPLSAQYYSPYLIFNPDYNGENPYRTSRNNIIDTLVKEDRFNNLVYELGEAGLTNTLNEGSYTIFAPNDRIFEDLSEDIFDRFSEPENRIKVLQYHIVPGYPISKETIDTGYVTTMGGETIEVTLENNKYTVNGINIVEPSIKTNHGLIIEIDRLLFPLE